MLFGDEEATGEGAPATVRASEIPSSLRRLPVKINPPAPVFHPLAYRGVVAEWPVEWRERWGRRANALEEKGLSWRDAEAQAFIDVWGDVRTQESRHSATSTLAPSDAERN
jgi:hypothetical protein